MSQSLAPYAVQVEHSRGRRYPEPPHPYRNDFQRDRDRVIHSRAFRRLGAKTQVFTGRFSDHFRNRLTHTIEVAQISRTIAAQLRLSVDLVETLALVQDIGHPPVGHYGGKARDAAVRQHGRYVDEVEKLDPDAPKKLQFNEVLRRILDRWVSDLIQNTQAQIDTLARPAINLDQVRACPGRLVGLSPQVQAERAETKEFLYRNLYYSPVLQPEKEAAERVITELFDLWMKHPEKLPATYQEKAKTGSEPRARVVCDYIAGMTDIFIYEQYEKYCGRKASVS